MNLSGKQLGVIFLDKIGIWFFTATLTQVVRFIFPQSISKDAEILNKDEFRKYLQLFIDTHKLPPSRVIVVLSASCIFEKDLPILSETERVTQVQNYIDNIPFEDVGIKMITFEKGTRVLATNRTFYDTVRDVFEKKGIVTEAVVPAHLFAREINFASGMDIKAAQLIMSRFDSIKQYSFPIDSKVLLKNVEHKNYTLKENTEKRRTMILLGVFLTLLCIMIIMLVLNTSFAQPKAPLGVASPATPVIQPTRLPTVTEGVSPVLSPVVSPSPSEVLSKDTVKITIFNGSAVAGDAEKIRVELVKIGYKNVQVGNSPVSTLSHTQVVLSSSLPGIIKSEIASVVAQLFSSTSVIESNDTINEATITTGKTTPP